MANSIESERMPEGEEHGLRIGIRVEPVWDKLRAESEYLELNYLDVSDAIFDLGCNFVATTGFESWLLRNELGVEEELDLMDPAFKEATTVNSAGVKPRVMDVVVREEYKEIVEQYAENREISTEELASRMLNMGLYALEQLRDGEWVLIKDKNGIRDAYPFYVSDPREKLAYWSENLA